MKNLTKIFISMIICFCAFNVDVYAIGINQSGGNPIKIDGYFDDWEDKPYSWEYNWNNPNDYWDNGKHVYATDEKGNPYNEVVRHKMSLYCDGENIYLYIKMAKNYYTALNGYDYQFWIDGQMAAFQVETMNGEIINSSNMKTGINEVQVKHRDSSYSWTNAPGSKAYLHRNADSINDELELKIPLKTLKQQNPNIDINNYKTIEFFTPNLMYRRISCSGTSTGPYVAAALCLAAACFGFYKFKRKGRAV